MSGGRITDTRLINAAWVREGRPGNRYHLALGEQSLCGYRYSSWLSDIRTAPIPAAKRCKTCERRARVMAFHLTELIREVAQ